jgi:hypothetical protein
MVHQPFEEWLAGDELLTPQQERDLQTHLRSCPSCFALSRANLSLRAAPALKPAPGFATRFQTRLAAERALQRKRAAFGSVLLLGAGVFIVLALLLPILPYLRLEPLQLFWLWLGNLMYFALALRTVSALGAALLNVLGQAVPLYAWWLGLASFSLAAYVWKFSLRHTHKQYARSVA